VVISKRASASHGSSLYWNELLYATASAAGLRRQQYGLSAKKVECG